MKHKSDQNGNTRNQTDNSLKNERKKSDRYLIEKSHNSEGEIHDLISAIREETDLHSKDRQARTDLERSTNKMSEDERGRSSQSLANERRAEGLSRQIERHMVDDAIKAEWQRLGLAAEALLAAERYQTDSCLGLERHETDRREDRFNQELLDMQVTRDDAIAAVKASNRFLAIVSHDLRNPLGTISMSALLMEQALHDGELDKNRLFKGLEIIKRNSASMDRMIRDLLDLHRIESGELRLSRQECDLNLLLKECVDMFRDIAAKKSIDVSMSPTASPVVGHFDRDRILQVLSNLVGNAVKFTPEGGKVVLSAKKENSQAYICVNDTGPGIPSDAIPHIFEEFSQLDRKDRRGLGLGLFISKAIVNAHGGTIRVDSELGKGSQFVLVLPTSQHQPSQVESPQSQRMH